MLMLYSTKLNNTFLLEKKNVGFFDYLSANRIKTIEVLDGNKEQKCIRINILKKDLKEITESDYQIFCNTLRIYQKNYAWVSLYFYDGTGIQYINCNPNNALYGIMDEYGKVTKILNVGQVVENKLVFFEETSSENRGILGINDDKNVNSYLCKIDDLLVYLDALKSDDYIVFIAVNDDCAGFLNSRAKKELEELGLKTNFSKIIRKSFVAIIDQNKVVLEKSDSGLIAENGEMEEVKYCVKSAGAESGKYAMIFINGDNFTSNWRGLNFAVYSISEKRVIDHVAFDTYSENWDCIRRP